ncbi:MAG TPA: toll/interleukin-1 receptor domain-containing protein [Steroidobacteraceae bacterium]|nr:toll/interleukin-1 receptor domain-containing protein [Steroidobacteraceae bacterium]
MAVPPAQSQRPLPSVFLSYASEDRQAAQIIREALPGYGLEVWYDESALEGGDAWDQKIRRQIRDCDFFMPLISAKTEARHEGYFRREWRLAVERTLDMADDHTFLLPVVIDETAQSGARVPEKFLAVQWTRLPGGQPTAAFEALCRRLASGQGVGLRLPRRTPDQPAGARPMASAVRQYPEFPREEPGQKVRFWALVIAWPFQAGWVFFNRFPKWIRITAYAWLFVALLVKGCSGRDAERPRVAHVSGNKINQLADKYDGNSDAAEAEQAAKLGTEIAKQYMRAAAPGPTAGTPAPRQTSPTDTRMTATVPRVAASGPHMTATVPRVAASAPLLVIPFSVPRTDPEARELAGSTFGQLFGKLSLSHHGGVSLAKEPPPVVDAAAAADLGREKNSKYVLFGTIEGEPGARSLAIKLIEVADGSVLWSKSYPIAGADSASIAADVDSKVQEAEDD